MQQNGGRDPFAGMMSPGDIGCCHGDCEAVAVSQSPDGSQWMWIRSAATWCQLEPSQVTHDSPVAFWVACWAHSVPPSQVCGAIAQRCLMRPPGT